MMIETKGTKAVEAADGAQKYDPQNGQAKTGTPYYLALAVAALAAYLKSLFQTPAQAMAPSEEDSSQSRATPKLSVVPATAEEADAGEPEARLARSSGSAAQSEAPASPYDSPQFLQARALRFASPDPGTDLNDFKASPVIPMPTNDNGGPGSRGGGGGGGGRHRGGGEKAGDDGGPDGLDPGGRPQPAADGADPPTDDGVEPPAGDGLGEGGPTGPDGRRNRAPVTAGAVHLADVTGCALLPIALSDLLRNVEDPDGDSLSVRDVTASSGTLTRDGDGWVYDGGALGPVTITYEVTDGEFSITHAAIFNVVERNLIGGTNGDDLILGTACGDEIDGRDGDDNIDARAGDDVVDGGAGHDHIVGGTGDDVIHGGAGDDVVLAGAGADHVSGGTGADRLFGEEGDDVLFGDAGDDLLDGGEGHDILVGGAGNDLLVGDLGDDRLDGGDGEDHAFGGAGRDVVSGGAGDDRLDGGAGDDALTDGDGTDVALGQEGDDVFVVASDGADDRFDGGAGTDALDLSGTVAGVVVDLAEGTSEGPETGRDLVASIEDVRGGSGADRLVGNSASNHLVGGAGRDHISGAAGNDLLDGGADGDTLSDGTGSDTVLGGGGDDVIVVVADGEDDRFDGGDGTDALDLSATKSGVAVDLVAGTVVGRETGRDTIASVEVVVAGSGADVLTGSEASETLLGGAGRDRVAGGGGSDHLDGGADDDALIDGAGSDIVLGGSGDDILTASLDGEADRFDGGSGRDELDLSATMAGVTVDLAAGTSTGRETGRDAVAGIEDVAGGSGDDALSGDDRANALVGGDGRDRISGGDGGDRLDGGAGDDTLSDGAGRDAVHGGAGDDVIVLALDGEGDVASGGAGMDTLHLGAATKDLLVDLVSHVVSGSENGVDTIESIERIVAGSGSDRFVVGDEDVVLTGGDGEDCFAFDAGANGEATRVVQITDFSVGDYVSLLRYSLFDQGSDALGHSLAEAMERNDGTVSGIQYRSARLDDGDVTVITADLDRDDTFETTIILDGHHTLLFVETANAAAHPAPPSH
ncbi:hypothetical protein ASG40_19825 [Methylobacterium sp. Leaf399]|uniref:calcium-binding protein n=1 Tax=Methylobacterium sp. Leaf399 TaxID=1736364 RepID=UPI0006F29E8F|nr:cadherin-like domain-containing protein [Methylobacterium sp. Leaf399]KQT13244.1 hypothetical protein ASG40_19825 [Methylobacterium sp. Leaf399]